MMNTTDELEQIRNEIAKLELQLSQNKALQEKKTALQNERDRKLETRKRILIGAATLKMIELGLISETEFTSFLNRFLDRPHDRKIFGLE